LTRCLQRRGGCSIDRLGRTTENELRYGKRDVCLESLVPAARSASGSLRWLIPCIQVVSLHVQPRSPFQSPALRRPLQFRHGHSLCRSNVLLAFYPNSSGASILSRPRAARDIDASETTSLWDVNKRSKREREFAAGFRLIGHKFCGSRLLRIAGPTGLPSVAQGKRSAALGYGIPKRFPSPARATLRSAPAAISRRWG
jgi:hypothetical protein